MDIEQALVLIQQHPEAVAVQGNCWSEYGIQLVKHARTGELCWTAGMTCGGSLDSKLISELMSSDWNVYTKWMSSVQLYPEEVKPLQESPDFSMVFNDKGLDNE